MATTRRGSALIVTPRMGAQKRLSPLLQLASSAGLSATLIERAEDVAGHLSDSAEVACIMVDASRPDRTSTPEDHISVVTNRIKGVRRVVVGGIPVIGVAESPRAVIVIAAQRAGADDFFDFSRETDASFQRIIDNSATNAANRVLHQSHLRDLRAVLEDFLRELVKTERRSIDLEMQLANKGRRSDAAGEFDANRAPSVLILEDDSEVANMLVDELEENGLMTYAFVSGEEAVVHVKRLAGRGEALDLAIVDAKLPGIDGIEAIKQMREANGGLAAILMTGFSDAETAVNAADIGVVGYVLKPFDDVAGLVDRIREQAEHQRDRSRERHYLSRIKERHDKVLLRYRRIAAELDEIDRSQQAHSSSKTS